MDERRRGSVPAYLDQGFLHSASARPLRILSEYVEPRSRFSHYQVEDTIVFMGSARTLSREDAEEAVATAEAEGEGMERAQRDLAMSQYYEAARELARKLTEWSKRPGSSPAS